MKHKDKKKQRDSTVTKAIESSVAIGGDTNRNKAHQAAKNVIVPNALTPIQLSWNIQRKKQICQRNILVHQSPDDDTWPGGAVWDLGWSLAHAMLAIAASGLFPSPISHNHSRNSSTAGNDSITTNTTMNLVNEDSVTHQQYHIRNTMTLPSRVKNLLRLESIFQQDECVVLELGCGVGLSGLVCALAFADHCSTTVILTDLSVVVERITLPNVQRNAKSVMKTSYPCHAQQDSDRNDTSVNDTVDIPKNAKPSSPTEQLRPLAIHTISQNGRAIAIPLCWGDSCDIRNVQSVIRHLRTAFRNQQGPSSSPSPRNVKLKCIVAASEEHSCPQPDVILIADVAYQHQPGAPSHFDVLVHTILQFISPNTILIFGLRVRMAASMDLYLQLLEHFDEIVAEPIVPQEIDPIRFQNVKPNTTTIHFLKQRKQ
jgi:predicted nicotinamide N-methyase